jgi:hypothetical protein
MRLQAFAGRWTLGRTIEDVRAGRAGTLAGTATFTPAPDGLAYAETGTLTLGDAPPMTATRSYLWRDAGANAIEVLFADGRFFHRFYADEDRPAAVHDCGADQYRVRYDFRRWPRWRAEWRVTGPAKDYGIVSDYRPAGLGPETAASRP